MWSESIPPRPPFDVRKKYCGRDASSFVPSPLRGALIFHLPHFLLPGSHAQLVFFSLLSCNCSSVLGNRGRKSQSFRRATMTIKQRWGREEESVSAGDERMRGGLAKEKGGRWRSAGPAEVEMKGKAVGRRDGVGDGSKRLSLLTSFSWEAESEGKGRSGAFILWMQGWSWLMRAANADTHTHTALSLSLSLSLSAHTFP